LKRESQGNTMELFQKAWKKGEDSRFVNQTMKEIGGV
jgi:hypothetical protein